MFSLFKKKNKAAQPTEVRAAAVVPMKAVHYPAKIILAWAKAVEGNIELSTWLTQNGYEELTMACAAIRLKDEARDWLMANGYPHLMAMIHAAEGNKQAQTWLLQHNFHTLLHLALAVENEQESWVWLRTHGTQDLFMLAQAIKKVKDEIEETHNDIHSFGRD